MNLPPGRRAGVFVCLSGGADIYASPINANNRPTLYIDGHEIRRVRRKIDHRAGRKGEGRGSGVGSSEERVDECHPVGAAWAVHAARCPRPQTDPQVGDGGEISEVVHVELHAGQTVARPLRAGLKPLGTGERTLSERRRPLPQVAHQGGGLRHAGQRQREQDEGRGNPDPPAHQVERAALPRQEGGGEGQSDGGLQSITVWNPGAVPRKVSHMRSCHSVLLWGSVSL